MAGQPNGLQLIAKKKRKKMHLNLTRDIFSIVIIEILNAESLSQL